MSTAIERARDVAELSRASGQDAWNFAKALATAGMLPKEYRDKPGNVLLAMEYGRALALPVATIFTSVHVIEGRPSMSSELMQALIRRAGHRIRIAGDNRQASCAIVRRDDPDFTYTATFTLEDAQQAGLLKIQQDGTVRARHKSGEPTNWEKYTRSMLLARAVSACARQACADVLAGVSYVPEELGEDLEPVVVTQAPSPNAAGPAAPPAGNPTPDTAAAPSGPPADEHPPSTDDPTPSAVQQERERLQRELDSEAPTLAAKARAVLMDELTGLLDAGRQEMDLFAIDQVGRRALDANMPQLVDEARAVWMDVQADLAELERERAQG
jgi:hypothetical protein